jgi:ribosomal protein S2
MELLSHHQYAEQNYDIKLANRCFENVVQFRYLGTTTTNQNWIQEEIKRHLNQVRYVTIQSRTFCLLIFFQKT